MCAVASGTEVLEAIQSFNVREGRSGRASNRLWRKSEGSEGNTCPKDSQGPKHIHTVAQAWYGSFEETILQMRNSANRKLTFSIVFQMETFCVRLTKSLCGVPGGP
jgi:hypothetical protein